MLNLILILIKLSLLINYSNLMKLNYQIKNYQAEHHVRYSWADTLAATRLVSGVKEIGVQMLFYIRRC